MATIVVRQFDYAELKARLNPDDGIVVLSCDGCARLCGGLGGREGLDALADKLVADGFNVTRRELLEVACSPAELEGRVQDPSIRHVFESCDCVIPLCCRAGEKRLLKVLPSIRMLGVTRALGQGMADESTGARLMTPLSGVDIEVDGPDGTPIAEAARHLGLHSGSF